MTDRAAPLGANAKLFPMPGTAWRWVGDGPVDPRPSGPHIVASLRWLRGETEVVFSDDSCVGVEHLMQSAAWEFAPTEPHDLTPSEVALAKMLAAWEEWPGDLDHHQDTLFRIGGVLQTHALILDGQPSPDGRALLDRARKAGVL